MMLFVTVHCNYDVLIKSLRSLDDSLVHPHVSLDIQLLFSS